MVSGHPHRAHPKRHIWWSVWGHCRVSPKSRKSGPKRAGLSVLLYCSGHPERVAQESFPLWCSHLYIHSQVEVLQGGAYPWVLPPGPVPRQLLKESSFGSHLATAIDLFFGGGGELFNDSLRISGSSQNPYSIFPSIVRNLEFFSFFPILHPPSHCKK